MAHDPLTKALAIPYLANNVPNERSRFENCIETSNYTIQSLLIGGVDKHVLRRVFEKWQLQARKELNEQTVKTIDETGPAQVFNSFTSELGMMFSQLDLEDNEQLSILHRIFQYNKPLIYDVLKHHLLKNIRTDTSILGSDSINLVDEVNSCQGISGTPSNYLTFHQALHYDIEVARGTDGYVYAGIKAKNPTLRGIDFKEVESFIADLFETHTSDDRVRAIVDISATFKNISNETVAKLLAQYIYQHPEQFDMPNALQYLLFFNANDLLSAVRIADDIVSLTPIVVGPSDPASIKERLGCDPDACFSYYDQSHTVGADLKQSDRARGLVLVDNDTTLDGFLQGAMRMRGLIEGEQRIDIIVPQRFESQSLDALVARMKENQNRKLQQDHFEAAQLKMINLVRADLKRRILEVSGPHAVNKKVELFALFKSYFIKNKLNDFFSQYGELTRERDTKEVLDLLQTALTNNWRTLLISAGYPLSHDEQQVFTDTMKMIVDKACELGVCTPKQMSCDTQLDVQVEVQQQIQAEVFVQMEVTKEIYNATRREEKYLSVMNARSGALEYRTLTSICTTTGASYIPEFSPDIIVSKNFSQSYQGQEKYIGRYLKPVHSLLFKMDEKEKLSCTLLSPQESQELGPWVNTEAVRGTCWISTTQHHLLAGTPPINYCDIDSYQEMIEQVRYFNGEFNLLIKKDANNPWLLQNSNEKMDFFEEYLAVSREALPSDINSMRHKLLELKRMSSLVQDITEDRTLTNSCKALGSCSLFTGRTTTGFESELVLSKKVP